MIGLDIHSSLLWKLLILLLRVRPLSHRPLRRQPRLTRIWLSRRSGIRMDFHVRNLTSVDSSKNCPYERARDIYLSEPCARTFEEDFHNHLRHGVVVSTPRAFVMARRADRLADPRDIVDSAHVFDGGDCLHIFLASGDLREIVRLLELSDHVHGRLEWLSWERNNVLRFYRRESLMSRGIII